MSSGTPDPTTPSGAQSPDTPASTADGGQPGGSTGEPDITETPSGRLLALPSAGAPVTSGGDANDLIGAAWSYDAAWVALPVERLSDDFFRLRTGLAGEIAQKFANYRLGLAIVGDVTAFTAASSALSDFVRETNTGRQLWFVPDRDELAARLAQ